MMEPLPLPPLQPPPEEEDPEPLEPGRTAPCLSVPSLQQNGDARMPPLSSAAAAAAVLVDGPCMGPFGAWADWAARPPLDAESLIHSAMTLRPSAATLRQMHYAHAGWTSVASQDGQLRIFATAPFLVQEDQGRQPRPLMLAHVLRLVGPGGPGALLQHAWAGPSPAAAGRQEYQYLATLHRDVAMMHATADPVHPPAPLATLRPCAEARCLDLAVASRQSGTAGTGAAAPATGDTCGPRGGEERLLVALGGSFGLEVHTVPGAGAASAPPPPPVPPPKRFLPRASVSLVRFSPDGRWLAVACLDGRVGVLDAAADLETGPSAASPFGHALVVRGERATALAFSRDGRRLAVACADGNVLLLRQGQVKGSGGGGGKGWEPCPVFLSPLRALRSAAASASMASAALGMGGSALSCCCWPSLAWSPEDRRLAVSLPGNGLSSPEIAVLDATSGARLGSLPMARSAQGMAPCPPPAGGFLQCIDEAGELRTFRWEEETPPIGLLDGCSSSREAARLLALTPTAAVWRLGEEEASQERTQGVLRLLWRREKRRGQQDEEGEQGWESVEVAVPFLPPGALVPWVESAEGVMAETRGRVVVGPGRGSLGLLFPELVYVCDWPQASKEANQRRQQQQQPEWRALGRWRQEEQEQEQKQEGGGDGRRRAVLLAAAFLGGGRLLAVVAQGDEVWVQSRPSLPTATNAASAGEQQSAQHTCCSLRLPEPCRDRRARWTLLSSCPPPSSSSSSSSLSAEAFVVVATAVSGTGTGTARLWRGIVTGDNGQVALPPPGGPNPLHFSLPPPPRPGPRPLPCLLPMDMRVGKGGREELRFWEVSVSGPSPGDVRQCCWILTLGLGAEASEEDEDEEGNGGEAAVSWRMATVTTSGSAAGGLLWPPPSRSGDGISSQ